VPLAITVRGDDVNVFAKERGRAPLIRWALRRADLVIALSHELKTSVVEIAGRATRVEVVPNGVDTNRFRPLEREAARRRLGIPDDARLIVSAGRLHASKGFPVLVEAAGRLRCPELVVAILGDPDSEADATRAMLAAAESSGLGARLLLPGAQSPDRLAEWYAAADLFALPTSREGSPNVLLEALACGLPCVSTPVGGIPEVLGDPAVGMMTSPTVDAFTAALQTALRTPWNRRAIAEIGSRRTWGRVADECCGLLASIARVPALTPLAERVPA
jgi:glycosyltransferase involved in cell wall biosynthesis